MDGTGRDVGTMSQKRFLLLLACLRFDNANDRETRRQSNPVAVISNIFTKLIENSQKIIRWYRRDACGFQRALQV
nr:unnamed protein product [Callosobruchus chinensis]